jgi:hypothetical protein
MADGVGQLAAAGLALQSPVADMGIAVGVALDKAAGNAALAEPFRESRHVAVLFERQSVAETELHPEKSAHDMPAKSRSARLRTSQPCPGSCG